MINIEKIKISNILNTKFCVISDIHHIKSCTKNFYNNVISEVRKEKPKYILIPGDIVDNPKIIFSNDIENLISFFKNLSIIAPVIISKGNHEQKNKNIDIKVLYDKIGKFSNIYILDNNTCILGDFRFIGFSPKLEVYLKRTKNRDNMFIEEYNSCHFNLNENKINILLCHSPEIITNVYPKLKKFDKINYVICGHMHNGLVPKFLESYFKTNGLFGPEYIFFPKFCRGIHNLDKTKLIVVKSLRVLTKDNTLFRILDKFYSRNITTIEL